MARSIDAILKELDAGYNPTRQLINQRLDALPAQSDAEINGLKAQEQDYYNNTILGGARERGVAFGGIPEADRARYGATQFLPAVARVRQSQNDSRMALIDALNSANRDQRTQAFGVQQSELDRAEQQRQFDEQVRQKELDRQNQLAAARASAPTLGDLNKKGVQGIGSIDQTKPNLLGQGGGAVVFKDQRGKPISAYDYAKLNNVALPDVLLQLGQQGDQNAANAYNWFKRTQTMDLAKDPNKYLALAQRNFPWYFKAAG